MSGEPDYQNTTQYNPYQQQQQQQPQYVQQQPVYVQQQQPYVQQQQYGQQPVYVQQQYGQQPVYVQQQPQTVYVQQQQQPQTVYVQQQPQPQQQMIVQQTQGTVVNFQSTTIQGEPGEYQCGTSTYGLRMDFKSRPYRDVGFLIFWCVAMFIWFILLIVFASKDNDDSDSDSRRLADDDGRDTIGNDFVGKIIGAFVIICVVGILCGFLWLNLMFRWAKNILKFLIGMKLLFWFILSLVCFIAGAALGGGFVVLGVLFLLVFLFFCLYYWCVRRRLRLAAAMIRLGTRVVQTNQATITLQFLTTIGSFVWWIIWVTVWSLYLVKYEYNGFVGFLMVLMGYWTLEVLANIAHVTTCGVTAVWWFNKDKMSNPTWQSYRYATTRGLGSICCGSFLVALIQTLRSMAKEGARRGGLAACIFYIILTFLEWLAHYFSMYAFVQVAIYGVTFWQAAKNTWDLLSSRGFDALINDDLSNMVLAAGAFVGGVVTFILGGFITLALFSNYDDSLAIVIAVYMGIIGFYIGYYFTLEFMFAVHSAIKAIFVCWAEDPAALKETHPKCYDLMATAWAKVYGEKNDGNYESLKTDQDLD